MSDNGNSQNSFSAEDFFKLKEELEQRRKAEEIMTQQKKELEDQIRIQRLLNKTLNKTLYIDAEQDVVISTVLEDISARIVPRNDKNGQPMGAWVNLQVVPIYLRNKRKQKTNNQDENYTLQIASIWVSSAAKELKIRPSIIEEYQIKHILRKPDIKEKVLEVNPNVDLGEDAPLMNNVVTITFKPKDITYKVEPRDNGASFIQMQIPGFSDPPSQSGYQETYDIVRLWHFGGSDAKYLSYMSGMLDYQETRKMLYLDSGKEMMSKLRVDDLQKTMSTEINPASHVQR